VLRDVKFDRLIPTPGLIVSVQEFSIDDA
jgi:hypothetical protein